MSSGGVGDQGSMLRQQEIMTLQSRKRSLGQESKDLESFMSGYGAGGVLRSGSASEYYMSQKGQIGRQLTGVGQQLWSAEGKNLWDILDRTQQMGGPYKSGTPLSKEGMPAFWNQMKSWSGWEDLNKWSSGMAEKYSNEKDLLKMIHPRG